MLKLIDVKKEYKVADNKIEALRGINLQFRRNEFVSVLGPSGCGKTTMLNIIGGLDRATSGDLVINDISTKNYKDRDWDVYRNRRIGFIFQSYNLIPHQTILGNVELSLTIAGMSKDERRAKAKAALEKVGIGDQINKRPNQLSGGQCQRVAIARALVNDPEILLADEPTGALDTVTSKQIMELVKEIAKERLVIMVTHNAELAEQYSTRIIRMLDGEVQKDSNPYASSGKEEVKEVVSNSKPTKKAKERAKMSFITAFKLSLQNLFTKKRRTVMTSIAGSIGIIGVSLVLSMSFGVQGYINKMQNDMLSGNPIEIARTGFDINEMMSSFMSTSEKTALIKKNGYVNIEGMVEELAKRAENMENLFVENEITNDYVQFVKDIPAKYLAAVNYDHGLDVNHSIYTGFKEEEGGSEYQISLTGIKAIYSSILKETDFSGYASMISSVEESFMQAPDAEDYILDQYNLLHGDNLESRVAKDKNEVMLVVGNNRSLADLMLAQLGYYTQEEFVNVINKATTKKENGYDKDMYFNEISFDRLIGKTFTWYPNDSIFKPNLIAEPPFIDLVNPFSYDAYYEGNGNLVSPDGLELTIVGILEPKQDLSFGMLQNGLYYTSEFSEYVCEQNKNSVIASALRLVGEDAFNNMAIFYPAGYQPKDDAGMPIGNPYIEDVIEYYGIKFDYDFSYPKGAAARSSTGLVGSVGEMESMMNMFGKMMGGSSNSSTGMQVLENKLFTLAQMGGNIDENQNSIPERIQIYPKDFKAKDSVLKYLDKWGSDEDIPLSNGTILTAEERGDITYFDTLSVIIKMIKTMVQIITYALVGFTSLALLVSCVMIGIITYVSVVERIKEIGIIRSLGGRKKDVRNLFVAETFYIGFTSGIIGIVVTYLLSGLINVVVKSVSKGVVSTIAVFPFSVAVLMVTISVGLTLISGLMPSRSAAKKDPVVALRTE